MVLQINLCVIVVVKWYSLVLAIWLFALGRGSIPRGDIPFASCIASLSSFPTLFCYSFFYPSVHTSSQRLHLAQASVKKGGG